MPLILNAAGVVICPHGGRVMLIPRQLTVLAQTGCVICEDAVVGAPIVGCRKPFALGSAPCRTVVAVFPGSTSMVVAVGGQPVCLATLTGLTDGVPPATVAVAFPGQIAVQA
jgi:hypothetical protein